MRAAVMTTSFAIGLVAVGCAYANDRVESDSRDIQRTNKSIHIDDGDHVGALDSVNGQISIGDRAVIVSAKTVNGSVRIGDDSRAQRLGTINGSVSVGQRTIVTGDISSVNGQLKLDDEAVVRGNVKNVNSGIVVGRRAHVGGKIVTTNGDITIQDDGRVDGGILVKESGSNWFSNLFGGFQRRPVITIGPGAQVGGELVFEHDVDLRVHPTAKIGTVTGASVERY
jgi:hypothetical protein